MTYQGYSAKVTFDSDAEVLHGEIIGLRGLPTTALVSSPSCPERAPPGGATMPDPAIRLDHVAITVRDIERSVAF